MKVWSKVRIKDKNKDIEIMSKSLTNYLYGYGPIQELSRKYKISPEDRKQLDQYTADRIGGLLMLYFAKDTRRINDILNKYNFKDEIIESISPLIEGYITKK